MTSSFFGHRVLNGLCFRITNSMVHIFMVQTGHEYGIWDTEIIHYIGPRQACPKLEGRSFQKSWTKGTPPSSFCARNACGLRYLAAGFHRASKTANLVQGTQVSSDAGHHNVHGCPAPTDNRHGDAVREKNRIAESVEETETISKDCYNLKERLKDWPVRACLALMLTSPVTTTRVVAIASMPSVTDVILYSRRTVGICRLLVQ